MGATSRQIADPAQEYGQRIERGNVLAAHDRHDEAAGELRAAAGAFPDHPAAHHNLGNTLLATGDREGATIAFRKALEVDADFYPAACNLAACLVTSGRHNEALGILSRPPVLRSSWGRIALGDLLAQMGKSREAFVQYAEAREIDPTNIRAIVSLARSVWALPGTSRLDEAIEIAREAARLDPAGDGGSELGSLLEKKPGPEAAESAIEVLRPVVEADRLTARAAGSWARLLARTGAPKEGVAFLEAWIARRGASGTEESRSIAWFALGALHERTGAFDAAFAAWTRGNQLSEQSSPVRAGTAHPG